MNPSTHKKLIADEAYRLGFSHVGVSKADFLEEEAPRLEKWLGQNMHGKMDYMANWFDKRLDPRLLVPGANSVVSLLLNYFPEKKQDAGVPQISKYAYGNDYHNVIKAKMKALLIYIKVNIGDVDGRIFVDSAPVLERAWAKRSGLGWVGKNSNLINPKAGSFFFIAEMILDLDIEPDAPMKDYCGTCTRCIDACPTEAIVAPNIVDGSKCISYFTIELKDQLPSIYKDKMENWAFGCDICQDVCPWNRFSKPHHEPQFDANEKLLAMEKKDWLEITEELFDEICKHSPLQRTGYNGMKKNIEFISPRV